MSFPYIPHTPDDIQQMLEAMNLREIEDLFDPISEKYRLQRPLAVPAAASEQEVTRELGALAARNANLETHDWFLGAGTYPHFTPSVVDSLISRSEFTTAYTPYQPEISQGTLQTIYEWQTMIASLTGVDVANASMYDGASATTEAALMAIRATRRQKVLVSAGIHPHYLQVLESYTAGLDAEIEVLPLDASGRTQLGEVDEDTACVILQQPNFLGCVESLPEFAEAAHAKGSLFITSVAEALSLALLESPGAQGADIVCGEAQSFGVPMSFGGPNLGFLATQTKRLRQLPGRLVGETVDANGRRGFVLTLSTREQHIRRERATSNICTNQGLCLAMATVYLSLMGRRGLRQLAEQNLARVEYAKEQVRQAPGLEVRHSATHFNEFVVRVPDHAEKALGRALDVGSLGGLALSRVGMGSEQDVLLCTTEVVNKAAIDRLIRALAQQETPS